jgi:hypothetical protein
MNWKAGALTAALAWSLLGCDSERAQETVIEDTAGAVTIRGEVWADNWFAFYLGERLIAEDSVSITTERSFNAESFVFKADLPLQLNFILKDFKENDTGLEYIGRSNQQMGDGGFIAQFTDAATGALIAATNSAWRCVVLHEAPLDRACEDAQIPRPGEGACRFAKTEEAPGWRAAAFDDSTWPAATEYSEAAVRPKGGYDQIDWVSAARLIWTSDLETHNTLLCRLAIPQGTERTAG